MTTGQKLEIRRYSGNPLLVPRDVEPSFPDWEVIGVFNAGVAEYQGEIILLLRVAERPRQSEQGSLLVPVLAGEDGGNACPAARAELREIRRIPGRAANGDGGQQAPPAIAVMQLDRNDPALDFRDPRVVRDRSGKTVCLTSISRFHIARSRDGVNFTLDPGPGVWPEGAYESWGIEDPRVTPLDGRYWITYSAVSDKGVAVGMMSTADFAEFRREGVVLAPTNKDVVLFPEKIGGSYYMLHRPVPDGIGRPDIWIARSPDLAHWGDHRLLMGVREGRWDEGRIGAGGPPIKTEAGWLVLYHGADRRDRYCMGAALLDLHRPHEVIARLDEPLLVPEADYETSGFFSGVVFSCGAVVKDGEVIMYYGASDDTMACAVFDLAPLIGRMSRPRP